MSHAARQQQAMSNLLYGQYSNQFASASAYASPSGWMNAMQMFVQATDGADPVVIKPTPRQKVRPEQSWLDKRIDEIRIKL